MSGQNQRLQLPQSGPLAEIDAQIDIFARYLEMHGVTGFVLAFNYKHGNQLVHTACLHQDKATPAMQTINPAQESVKALYDLLWITDERNRLKQPRRYCAPTLLPLPEPRAIYNPPRESALAHEYLADLQLAEGWHHYSRRDPDAPGEEIFTDSGTLHIVREQGIGDELFFLRWLPLLSRPAIYYTNPKLAELLRAVDWQGAQVTVKDAAEAPDDAVRVGHLPHLLDPENVQPPLPLPLMAPFTLNGRGLPPFTLVSWRAGTRPSAQHSGVLWSAFKSIPLEPLGKVLKNIPGTIISIQRDPGPELALLEEYAGRRFVDLETLHNHLPTLTQLIAMADFHIGPPNTAMHLAAGIGKRAAVLLPYPAQWNYTRTLEVSPWFPSFTLYRQDRYGDWTEAFAQLEKDLETV